MTRPRTLTTLRETFMPKLLSQFVGLAQTILGPIGIIN